MTKQTWVLALVASAIAVVAAGCGSSGAKSNLKLNGLKVGYAETLDTIDVADQAWIRSTGGKVVRLSENQTVVTAVSRGNIDVGNAQFSDVAQALAQKNLQNVRILYMGEQTIPFIFVARAGINSLSDLAGKAVAYHSPGSLTEILARLLVRQADPGLESKIRWRIVPESANRAAALRAGRIDAAVLDYPDVVRLQKQRVKLSKLGVWTDLTGPSREAVNTVWIVRNDVYEKNKATMEQLAQKIQDSYDRFYASENGWIKLANQVLSVSYDRPTLASTYEFYKGITLYPKRGTNAFSVARLNAMNTFFRSTKTYTEPVAPRFIELSLIRKISLGQA